MLNSEQFHIYIKKRLPGKVQTIFRPIFLKEPLKVKGSKGRKWSHQCIMKIVPNYSFLNSEEYVKINIFKQCGAGEDSSS